MAAWRAAAKRALRVAGGGGVETSVRNQADAWLRVRVRVRVRVGVRVRVRVGVRVRSRRLPRAQAEVRELAWLG